MKDLARQGLISFTKHKRPVSSEDLEVLYVENQLGLNAPDSFRHSLTLFSNSEREAVKTNGCSENAECGVRSAECGVRSAECGVRSAE